MNISRSAFIWLLIMGTALIVPQLLYLPWWVLLLWIGCAYWRWQVFKMRRNLPKTLFKTVLAVVVIWAIFVTHGNLVGLDAFTSFMVSLFASKLLELKTKRDAWVLVLVGFMMLAAGFLFEDNILAAFYSVIPLSMMIATMIALHQSEPYELTKMATWLYSCKMLLQAAPLMLIMFVLFPRLDPLWNVPRSGGQSSETGLSEIMNPADIMELTNSTEKAFKVIFADNVMPSKLQLYWRAITYEDYDGRKWSQVRSRFFRDIDAVKIKGEMLDYQIIMQPHYKYWLFSIAPGFTYDETIHMTGDFRIYRTSPINQVFQYGVLSYPQSILEPNISLARLQQNLRLPQKGNPKTRAFAQNLAITYEDPQQMVKAITNHLRRNDFKYTLQPGLLGENSIDEFFFTTKKGFCAHYAEAMTFILREAGVPARVVAGYQGGDWNESGKFLQVRQSDAHAWVEYWVKDLGWIHVDPTFAIAPSRINVGLANALAEENSVITQTWHNLTGNNLVKGVTDKWDAINHQWQLKVLSYQNEQQNSFLSNLVEDVEWNVILIILGAFFFSFMMMWAVLIIQPLQYLLPIRIKIVKRFDKRLRRKLGLLRTDDESISSFAARAVNASNKIYTQEAIMNFAKEFEYLTYAQNESSNSHKYNKLKAYLKHIK